MHHQPRSLILALRAAIPLLALHATLATAQTAFTPKVLHRFTGTTEATTLGGLPESPPILGADGMLYGTTRNAGDPVSLILPQGALYRVDPAGAAPYSFKLLGDLSTSTTTLVRGSDGTLYGGSALSNVNNTSLFGGTPAAFTVKNGVPALLSQPTQGPRGQLAIDELDRIYLGAAETPSGCSATVRAPLRRLNPDGTETKLLDFCDYAQGSGSAETHPKGTGAVALVWSRTDQALYVLTSVSARGVIDATATTDNAGRSVGTLVKVSKAALEAGAAAGGVLDASQVELLHTFLRNRDGEPTAAGGRLAGLVEAGEWLYGTSYSNPPTAGTQNSEIYSGTVWRVKKGDPASFTVLHRFRGTATLAQDGTATGDGGTPAGPLVLAADGNIYGTTQRDGTIVNTTARGVVTPVGAGTVYRIVPGTQADRADDKLEIVHRFDFATEGGRPVGLTPGVVAGGVQKLYGANSYGGSGETLTTASLSATGFGTVYAIDIVLPTVAFTTPLSVSATTARVGDRVTLGWATSNAASCTASGDNGELWSGAQQATAADVPLLNTLTKVGDNTFTLRCESLNDGPAVEQTVTVTVEAAPVVTQPTPDTSTGGGSGGGGPLSPWLLLPLAGLALSARRTLQEAP